MVDRTAAIHGTGLLGASVGLSLRAAGWRVMGWDPDPDALEEAHHRGAIDAKLASPLTDEVDLVVLAAPPEAVVTALREMDSDALVTDIAGVKMPIVEAAVHLRRFVGGHPMAGGETSGASLATSRMFHGATWVLTTDGARQEDLDEMSAITRSFGANPITMTAAAHDAAVARVSHLPHVLATALLEVAAGSSQSVALAGGGFRDLTRVAASASGWWAEVLAANAGQIDSALARLEEQLGLWRRAVASGDVVRIAGILDHARELRAGLAEHHSQVRVILLDRPGEVARVGHALESSRVDVRDFQLRHGEHGGGGILTISVRPSARAALEEALTGEGFELQPG